MATRKAKTPEGAIQRSFMDLLRLRGLLCWRINSGAMKYGDNRRVFFILGPDGKPFHGFGDLLVILDGGRWMSIEVKAPGGRPTAHQLAFLEAVRVRGGVALMIHDVTTLNRVLDRLEADPWARFTIEGELQS